VPFAQIVLLGASLAPRIGWDAAASCPDATTAQAGLDRLLASSPPAADPPDIRVAIAAEHDRFVARVQLGDAERTLEGERCDQVADAAILIVAMAIDPRLRTASPEPLDVPEPEPTAEPPPPTPSSADPPTSPRPSSIPVTAPEPTPPPTTRAAPPKALLRAGAGLGLGGPPSLTATIAIGVAASWPRARVELDGDLWTPRDDREGIRVIGWTIGVRGCGSPIARRFELPLCAGLRTGALRGTATTPLTPSPKSSIWLTATAGLGLWGWIRPRFALALDVEAMVTLTTPRFVVQPSGHTYSPLPAGLRAIFGPVVRLP
jgi:hypothetical protein